MPATVFTHPDCLRHDPGPDHPETPARLQAILSRLGREPGLPVVQAEPSSRGPLLAVHSPEHLDRIQRVIAAGLGGMAAEHTGLS